MGEIFWRIAEDGGMDVFKTNSDFEIVLNSFKLFKTTSF
jgi:hypothetical protein